MRIDLSDLGRVLDRLESDDLDDNPTEVLIDLYAILSEETDDLEDLRGDVKEVLNERVDEPTDGDWGRVTSCQGTSRSLSDDAMETLVADGVDPSDVMSVDKSKVRDAVDDSDDLEEADVFEIYEYEYIRKLDLDVPSRQLELDETVESFPVTSD